MGETLSKVFPGLVRALVESRVWTRGPQELTDGNAQDSQSLPFIVCQRVTRTWSWDVSQKLWNYQRKQSVLVWHRENGALKFRPKICPQIRPQMSDAAISAGTLEASEPHLKGHGNPPCPEHCLQWFCDCASKMDDGELVVPCLC